MPPIEDLVPFPRKPHVDLRDMMPHPYLLLATSFLLLACTSDAFELGQIFNRLPKISAPLPNTGGDALLLKTKSELLSSISNTANGKEASLETQRTVLQLVQSLETSLPVSQEILSDPDQAKLLDGVWYLQYTAPSDIDDTSVVRSSKQGLIDPIPNVRSNLISTFARTPGNPRTLRKGI